MSPETPSVQEMAASLEWLAPRVASIAYGRVDAVVAAAALRALAAERDALRAELEAAQAPLTLDTAPIGTKAPAFNGGHWTRVAAGWKWCTGSTFPRPGGDWTGELVAPDAATQAPRDVPRLTDEDVWKSDDIMSINAAAGMHMPTLMRLVRAVESRVREMFGVAPRLTQIGWGVRADIDPPGDVALWKSRPTPEDIADIERAGVKVVVVPVFAQEVA